jgi:hypothetical protein
VSVMAMLACAMTVTVNSPAVAIPTEFEAVTE